MWDTVKSDPVLRGVIVVVLGLLGFGIVYNVLFVGGGTGFGMGPHAMGYGMTGYGMGQAGGFGGGYLLNGALPSLYAVVINLLVATLVIAAIALLIKNVVKIVNGEKIMFTNGAKNDPLVRTLVVVGVTLLALMVITPIVTGLFSGGFGSNMGYNNMMRYGGDGFDHGNGYAMMGYGGYRYGGGFGGGFDINSILMLLIRLFLILSVVGAIIGLVMYVTNSFKLTNSVSGKCASCGAAMKPEWNYCPSCSTRRQVNKLAGEEKDVASA